MFPNCKPRSPLLLLTWDLGTCNGLRKNINENGNEKGLTPVISSV